jgi:hypothetical protein
MNNREHPLPAPEPSGTQAGVAGGARAADPLSRTLDALDTLRSELSGRVSALDEHERAQRAGDEGWTPVQVLQHLCLVERVTLEGERRVFGTQARTTGAPPLARRLRYRLGRVVVALVFRFGLRVRVPTPRVIPEPPLPLADVLGEWSTVSSDLRRRLESAHEGDAAAPFLKHPVSGPLTAAETAAFLLRHMRHHARQLDRILG